MEIFDENDDLFICLMCLMPSAESPEEVADQLAALCQMMALVIGNYIKPERIDEVTQDLLEQVTSSAHVIRKKKGEVH